MANLSWVEVFTSKLAMNFAPAQRRRHSSTTKRNLSQLRTVWILRTRICNIFRYPTQGRIDSTAPFLFFRTYCSPFYHDFIRQRQMMNAMAPIATHHSMTKVLHVIMGFWFLALLSTVQLHCIDRLLVFFFGQVFSGSRFGIIRQQKYISAAGIY